METQGSATPAAATEATAATTQEQTTTQGAAEQTQPSVTPNLKKFKLKVDGEEFEEELDLSNEAELTKRLQLARAAEKRISQAKTEKQKAMEILQAFERGDLLKKHPKARELAEQFLVEQLESEMLTPEQKELKELKAYKDSKEKAELERQKALEQAEMQQQEKVLAEKFQKTIIDALDKSGLPKTPEMAKRAAYLLKKNLDLGLSLSAEDLVQEMKSEATSMLKSLIGQADGDQLIAMFGEDVAKKIRAYDVKRLKEKMNQPASSKKEDSKPSIKSDGKPLTIDEWKEQVRARLKG